MNSLHTVDVGTGPDLTNATCVLRYLTGLVQSQFLTVRSRLSDVRAHAGIVKSRSLHKQQQWNELLRRTSLLLQAVARFGVRVWTQVTITARWLFQLPGHMIDFLIRFGYTLGHATVQMAIILIKCILCLIITASLFMTLRGIYRFVQPAWMQWRIDAETQRLYQESQDRLERGQQRYQEQIEQARRLRDEQDRQDRVRRQRELRDRQVQKEAERLQREQDIRRESARRVAEQAQDYQQFKTWRQRCDQAFEVPETFAIDFPEPPHWDCDKSHAPRHLKACEHSLRRLFAAGGDLQNTLEEERNRRHANGTRGSKLYRLRGEQHRVASEKAKELSCEIQSLLNEMKGW